jgi:hypothetical protein
VTLFVIIFLLFWYYSIFFLYYFGIIQYYLCIKCIICIVIYLSRVRRNSPSVPAGCWRRIPVDRSARGVNDSDLYCSGSAHGVQNRLQMLERCRRCTPMAVRELNSPEQWMHLNPTACGTFAFAGALSPVRDAGMRIPEVVFTMQFKLKLRVNCSAFMEVCRDSLHSTTKYERNKNVPTNVNSPLCMVSYTSFAIQANHDCKRQWHRHVQFKK